MVEPAAPGTEDEFQLPQISKKETEQERLLSLKAYLDTGEYGQVFELNYINGAEYWYCNLCRCSVMGKIYNHETGKRHTIRMALWKSRKTGQFDYSAPQTSTNEPDEDCSEEKIPDEAIVEIAPGEPVPPGFENEVEKVAQIQDRLNGYNMGPLVGLEYVLELQDTYATSESNYLCILCDKKGDPRTIITHLSSFNHTSQYLQKHFRTVYRALTPYMTKQYKRNWHTCMVRIAEAIERRFGRLKPMPVELDKFEKNRMFYLGKIAQAEHFQEGPNVTFVELVTKEELTKTYDDGAATSSEKNQLLSQTSTTHQPAAKRDPSPPVVQRPTRGKPKQPPTAPGGIQGARPNQTSQQNQQGEKQKNLVCPRIKSLSPVSSISSSELSDFEPDKKKDNMDRQDKRRPPVPVRRSPPPSSRRRSRSPFNRRAFGRRSPSPRRMSPSPRRIMPGGRDNRREDFHRESGTMPWERSNYVRKPNVVPEKKHNKQDNEKDEKMEEFKKLAKAIESDMERVLKQHEKNPEKHPQYNEEWKKFWNKRYKELQIEGKDASKHDFKPEWILFWNKRMKEIHDEEVKNKKDALRRRLGLMEQVTPIKFRIGGSSEPVKEKPDKNSPLPHRPIPPSACPDSDPEVIIIDDKDDSWKTKRRSRSPYRRSGNGEPASKQRKVTGRDESPQRMIGPHKRESVERASAERRSLEHKYSDRRSSERKPPGKEKQIREGKPSAERRSLDRLSLDRISSSSGSSSDETLNMPDTYREYRKRMDSKEKFFMDRGPPGKEYVRSRSMHYQQGGRPMPPWEKPPYHHHEYYDQYKPPMKLRDVTRQPVMLESDMMDDDDSDINIVAVLRLLTALEEKLGSLGPKVNDLLAQALAMEKAEANSSEKLLDNDVNCVLFETVKEKLKGQLLSGLVDYIQERAYKRAIKKTASLIHLAGTRKTETLNTKPDPVKVPGVGTVDKAAIARQIATALVMQGKTDVTQQELEQLINAVVGMAEASQKTDKPLTTADFLNRISGSFNKDVVKEAEKIHDKDEDSKSDSKSIIKEILSKDVPIKTDKTSNMDQLSDSDLQTLLQSFKDLSTEEQHSLINYLKTLEAKEPERVEKLRKFVNLGGSDSEKNEKQPEEKEEIKKPPGSPFSKRLSKTNPDPQEKSDDEQMVTIEDDEPEKKPPPKKDHKVNLDSDEEDYTFEDVVKAVSKNVEEKEAEKKRDEDQKKKDKEKEDNEKSAMDTQTLISNLLSNFSKSTSSTPSTSQTPVSAADFTKTLSSLPINLDNLVNIVGNVKSMQANQNKNLLSKPDVFEDNSNSQSSLLLDKSNVNTNNGRIEDLVYANKPGLEVDRPRLPGFDRTDQPSFDRPVDNLSLEKPGLSFDGPFSLDRPSRDFGRHGQGFDRPGPGFNRPSPGFDIPGPGFDRPGPGFDRSGPGFEGPGPGLDRPAPSFDRPAPGFDRPAPGFDRSGAGFDRAGSGFDRTGAGFDMPGPGFERPTPGFDRQGPGFDRPGPGLDRPVPGLDRPVPGFDRPGPGLDRPGPGSDRAMPGFDRPGPGFDRSGPGFDRSGPGFDRSGPGFDNRSGPGFDRSGPGFDNRPGPGFDRSGPGPERTNDRFGSDFDRPGPPFNRQYDQFDIERNPKKADIFDIPGPEGLDKKDFDRPLSDRLGPAMDRLSSGLRQDRSGFDRGGPLFDRPGGNSEPFIPPLHGQDRPNIQYQQKGGMPNFRGKNPQYSQGRGGAGQTSDNWGFDDGYGRKARGRGGGNSNRW